MIPALTAKAAKAPPSISQAPREPGRAPLDGRERRRRAPTIANRRSLSITPLSSLRKPLLTGARVRRCDRARAPVDQVATDMLSAEQVDRYHLYPFPAPHPARSRNVAKGSKDVRGGVYTSAFSSRSRTRRFLRHGTYARQTEWHEDRVAAV